MASAQQVLRSPTELEYLHRSLSLSVPIRPDGRRPRDFRPITAEVGILPGTNGSARVFFADGTEAIVGVKAEVAKTEEEDEPEESRGGGEGLRSAIKHGRTGDDLDDGAGPQQQRVGRSEWLEITVEIPGFRDDDPTTVFLSSMLTEALLADKEFPNKLYINRRFHWRLYLDIFLISQPLSYPLPLLSITTHLALLTTRLPRLKSEGDEDPMFDDDWEASNYIYPKSSLSSSAAASSSSSSRPPITLLVIAVGDNILFDPTAEELCVAETVMAVSVGETTAAWSPDAMDQDGGRGRGRDIRLLAIRTVDPPSRLTPPGVAISEGAGQQGGPPPPQKAKGNTSLQGGARREGAHDGLWRAPLGGTKFSMVERIVRMVIEKGGMADEVLDGLDDVELES